MARPWRRRIWNLYGRARHDRRERRLPDDARAIPRVARAVAVDREPGCALARHRDPDSGLSQLSFLDEADVPHRTRALCARVARLRAVAVADRAVAHTRPPGCGRRHCPAAWYRDAVQRL